MLNFKFREIPRKRSHSLIPRVFLYLDVIGPTILTVGRPNRVQDCVTDFTCTKTCGPYSGSSFVIYDLGSVKRLGLIEIQLQSDVSFDIKTFRSGVNPFVCHSYIVGEEANTQKKTIATCVGREARFIQIETNSTEDSLDICYLRYYLEGKIGSS